jgi:hypothetical protein
MPIAKIFVIDVSRLKQAMGMSIFTDRATILSDKVIGE